MNKNCMFFFSRENMQNFFTNMFSSVHPSKLFIYIFLTRVTSIIQMQGEGEMSGFEDNGFEYFFFVIGFGLMKRITTKIVLLVLMVLVIVLSNIRVVVVVVANGDSISRKMRTDLEVDRKLKLLNKPAIKSIQSEDGDIIDCVDLYKQPAFDHPALKNHIIQMEPTYDPTMEEEEEEDTASDTVSDKDDPPEDMVLQVWKRSGSCPKGTIPIRRIRKEDLLRTNSLGSYGRKNPQTSVHVPNKTKNQSIYHETNTHLNDQNGDKLQFQVANHSMAAVMTEGFSYSGAKAEISIWNPYVEGDDEFSSAQIWLKNGHYNSFESIESGWIVNPAVYGDRNTRLFAYWTTDASKNTGCFDLTCSGFVQTSTDITIGATLDSISDLNGPQYIITLFIFKDQRTSNWWLQYGNRINIGYWPPEIFNALRVHASFVEWGGEVYSTKIGNNRPHTATQMGSGSKLSTYGNCFVQHIRIKDYAPKLKFPRWFFLFSDEYYCYEIYKWAEYWSEPMFYFGGPGRNYNCP